MEEWVKLDGYEGTVRQLIVTGLGHESPRSLLDQRTRHNRRRPAKSSRPTPPGITWRINSVNMDDVLPPRRQKRVRLNVDFDLTLTVLADPLYRNLADRLKGFAGGSVHVVSEVCRYPRA